MFQITLLIILAVFLVEISLSMLNYRHRNKPIPKNVADVYNQEEYNKWLRYTMEITRLSILNSTVEKIVLLLFLSLGAFPMLDRLTQNITSNTILQTLLFLGFYMAAMYILSIGFRLYRTFSIEERFGFNTSTVNVIISDQIKSILLAASLGGALLYVLLSLYERMGRRSFLYTWLIVMAIIFMVNILYTRVFVRLFNHLTPLTEGELYQKTRALAKHTGYKVQRISIMDASKRSTKLNAFFTGFGKFKHIILYDTLLEKCSTDEIISILAHEIGHANHKDTSKNLIVMAIQTAAFLFLLSFFLSSDAFAIAFGFQQAHYGFALILFSILMEPVSLVLGIPMSAFSRRAEYKADAFAAKSTDPNAMVRALKILARENYANLTPHPAVVRMTYSHPPISDRIAALEQE